MSPAARRSSLALLSLVAAAWTWLALGCAGDPGRPEARRRGPPRAAMQPLAGQEVFFGGVIAAEVLVGALSGFDHGGDGGAEEGGGRGPGRRGGGGGGMHLGGSAMGLGLGGGGGGGPGGGRRERGGEGEGPGEGGPGEGARARGLGQADFGGGPPVMIHVRLTNTGAEPAEIAITDFLSPLGNFVVQPDRLKLAAGESAELEPMTSRLAGEISAADVTLALRRNGTTETKTIVLQPKPAPARPASGG